MAILSISCSEDEPMPEQLVTEQTNIKIEGDLNYFDEQSSVENDNSTDILTYDFTPSNPKSLTFIINLENSHTLRVNIHHRNLDKVWETPTNYPVYASQDTSQHWKYCYASYQTSSEAPSYYTHLGTVFPKGTDIDAFELVSYDAINKSIKCRFRDLILFKNTDPNQRLTINGTFIGAATF